MFLKNIRKITVFAIILICLAACNLPTGNNQPGNNNQNTANNAADNQTDNDDQGDPIPDFPGKEVCEELSNQLATFLPLTIFVSQEEFEQQDSGLGGTGCRIFSSGDGDEIADWGGTVNAVVAMFNSLGWIDDPAFSAGGAGGMLNTYRRGEYVCSLTTEVGPVSQNLCSQEPLSACLERLNPQQILYQVTIECTPDQTVVEDDTADDDSNGEEIEDFPPQDSERIMFDPGATTAARFGSLQAIDRKTYVLNAQQGQQMVVELTTSPPISGQFSIIGLDGSVLISDYGDTMFWYGDLPLTQDYFIRIHASPETNIDYTVLVIIPPPGETYIAAYSPLDQNQCQTLADQISQILGVPASIQPALFEDYLAQTAGTGCKITAWGDGLHFTDWFATTGQVTANLEAQGWVSDMMYDAAGPGGMSSAYRRGEALCIYTETTREISRDLCPDNQPISMCWADLPPEQMTYSITLNCAVP